MTHSQRPSPDADRSRSLGNALSLLFELAALVLALMAVRLTFGWPWGAPAETAWPGVLTALAHLITATAATMLLAMYARGRLLLRGVVLGVGYVAAVYTLWRVFLG